MIVIQGRKYKPDVSTKTSRLAIEEPVDVLVRQRTADAIDREIA